MKKQARERREKIQAESSFFGAMDGATKYVKGDAVAGLIITFINLIGGTAMGMMRQGLPFADAIQQYGLLTIGDGLVSQIPSLVISLSTGILVTKASKEADFGEVLIEAALWNPQGIIHRRSNPDLFRNRDTFKSNPVCSVWCNVYCGRKKNAADCGH